MLSFDVDAFVAAVNDIPTEDVSSSSPTTAALAEPVRDELVEELRKAVEDLQDENEVSRSCGGSTGKLSKQSWPATRSSHAEASGVRPADRCVLLPAVALVSTLRTKPAP